jgi:cell division protease FtsH
MAAQKAPNKFSKYSFLILVFISLIFFSYLIRNPAAGEEEKLKYSEFLNRVASKQVTEVAIVNNNNKLHGTLTNGKKFMVDAPADDKLVSFLRDNGVSFSAENPGLKENLMQFLAVIVVPLVVILAIWFLIMRQAQMGGSQALSFGRSRAKVLTDNLPPVTFEDVAGVDEAVGELREIVEFLRDPKRFQTMGAKIPKGVLLLGPPGSGKTLLARAIAGEAKVPFFHMSGSDFVEMFVGVGASRVRDLFDQAKRSAPCLVFVDEIDAVGRQRGAGLGGGHDEREQTLNQLLVEMDGFDANIGVILIAATNRPDVLDPALLRPGRFDRRVIVDQPDLNGRRAILEVHARGKPIDPSVDLDVIARRTPGFTGADLSNVLNEAAILAARNSSKLITLQHIEESIDRNIAGPERKSRLLSERDRKVTAYHEAGHALVAKLIPGCDPVHKISILPRGMALGYTLQLPLEDKYVRPRSELVNEISVLLGGRSAEEIVFDDISTGASNDIERATKIARRMVTQFGMSEELGPIAFGRREEAVFLGRDFMHERDYSEEIAYKIDLEVRKIIDDCHKQVTEILKEHKDRLDLVAAELIEHEYLEGIRLETLLEGQVLGDEEITELEADKKKKDEEKNRLRLEAKEAGEKERQRRLEEAAAALDGRGAPEEVETAPAPATVLKETVPLNEVSSVEELKSAAGLFPRFYNLLEKTFKEIIDPFVLNDHVREQLERIEKVLSESKADFASILLQQLIRESEDAVVEAGFRIRLALLHASAGRAERVVDELLAALQTGADGIEKKTQGILVSSISYFRIFNEELRKQKVSFAGILRNAATLEEIDRRYGEWESKTRTSSDSFFPMA